MTDWTWPGREQESDLKETQLLRREIEQLAGEQEAPAPILVSDKRWLVGAKETNASTVRWTRDSSAEKRGQRSAVQMNRSEVGNKRQVDKYTQKR